MGLLKFLRRLWWKINFRNPLFSYDFPLNGDVLRTISQLLSRRDLVNLRSSCRFAYDALEHDIYLNIELSSMAQCVNGLKFLSTQPNKHHLIKGLDLRPINAPYPPGSSNLPHRLNLIQIIRFEYFVVGKMLHQIIPQLTSLQRFRWDGFRVPPDEIWVLLRQKFFVPLKDVHCRSWSNFENLSSEIFKFVGLRSFAFFASGIFQPVDDLAVQYTKLPSSLFEMLSQCPKLENLALGGLEFETMRVQLDLNACPILFFHWPQLKNLSLTQVSFHSAQGIGKGIQKTYNNFFNLHEALHTLTLTNLRRRSKLKFPSLKSYKGTWRDFDIIRPVDLHQLDLWVTPVDELGPTHVGSLGMDLNSVSPLDLLNSVQPILRHSPELEHLSLPLNTLVLTPKAQREGPLQHRNTVRSEKEQSDRMGLVKDLLSELPQLKSFIFLDLDSPIWAEDTLNISEFSKMLSKFSQLKHIQIHQYRVPGNAEEVHIIAGRLASLPKLESITICKYVPTNQLKLVCDYSNVFACGKYEIIRSPHRPLRMVGHEILRRRKKRIFQPVIYDQIVETSPSQNQRWEKIWAGRSVESETISQLHELHINFPHEARFPGETPIGRSPDFKMTESLTNTPYCLRLLERVLVTNNG